jgi:hypothetical protein
MDKLQGVRQRFILGSALLGALNLALLVYVFWSGSGNPSFTSLQQKYTDLKIDVARREKSNPEKTREELKRFYAEDIPAHDSQISEQVDKLTRDAGVAAPSIQYPKNTNPEKNGLPGVQEIRIETNVSGDYEKVARFINALEKDKMLFIIDKISLTGQQGGTVSLQITFSTFLREPEPGPTPAISNKGL